MLNSNGEVIYVGKAKNLKNRVTSYFSGTKDLKTEQLIAKIAEIEVTVTRSEEEALILELQLIKQLQPKYNLIFKDAKSYPYIHLATNEEYPKLTLYRGKKQTSGECFGPYPNVRAAKEGVELLQKIFGLRSCDNNFFKNRKRPCLQYQIHRCTGPCVGIIDKQEYLANVVNAKKFLQGKAKQVIDDLILKMENASKKLLYEQAAYFRQQIIALRNIQKQQIIIDHNHAVNIDILGVAQQQDNACIHLLSIREGHILGSRQYFPKETTMINPDLITPPEILETFILQHYGDPNISQQLPDEIVVAMELLNKNILQTTLHALYNKNIKITRSIKGYKTKWLKMAQISAREALNTKLERSNNLQQEFLELRSGINFERPITKIECFDISHIHGEATIGACVVFTPRGPLKKEYRKYNIKTATKGDDYTALAETLERHYSKISSSQWQLPDLVLIDGGKGQLTVAKEIIQDKFNLLDIQLLAIAKGKTRKIGSETVYLSSSGNKLTLPKDAVALRLMQKIRDETHAFAITGHRIKRTKNMLHSSLENITGIGAKRRKELLKQFGGLKEVCYANMEDLTKINGISIKLAKRIYDELHKDSCN